MIDSAVRSTPSATRIRPESAAWAASLAVSRPGRRSARSWLRPVTRCTRSIAPRTEEPIRTSRCSRVARIRPTDSATTDPFTPVTAVVMARSDGSSW